MAVVERDVRGEAPTCLTPVPCEQLRTLAGVGVQGAVHHAAVAAIAAVAWGALYGYTHTNTPTTRDSHR